MKLIPFQRIDRVPFITVFIIIHYLPSKLQFLVITHYLLISLQFLVFIKPMEQVHSDLIAWIVRENEINHFLQYFRIVLHIGTCQMHDIHSPDRKTLFIPKYDSQSLLIRNLVTYKWNLTLTVILFTYHQYKHILLIINSSDNIVLLTYKCLLLYCW